MLIRIIGPLVFITIIFQHFRIFTFSGYEVTLGAVTGIATVCLLIRRVNFRALSTIVSILIALTSGVALLTPETDALNYLKTLALFALSAFIVTNAFGSIQWPIVKSRGFAIALLGSLALVVGISVGQLFFGSIGSSVLFNPFGEHQYLHLYKANIGLVQFPRAQGFYLEPSYNAFVIGTVAVALLCLRRFIKLTVVLSILGLIASQSATGLLLLVAITVLIALRSRPAIAVAAAAVVTAVVAYAGDYLWIRLQSSGTSGSSAYYRVFAPVEVLSDVLSNNPFGMPLGSVQRVMAGYDLDMAGIQATSLDNGFYVVVFYFGWIGIFLLIAFLIATLRISLRSRLQSTAWIAPLWIFGSLFFSGGIMAPEFGVMTFLVIVSFRSSLLIEESQNEKHNTIEYSNRHLYGSRGSSENN